MTKPTSIHRQIVKGLKPVARVKLDEIRKMVGAEVPPREWTCLTCGAECLPIAVCRVCGGKRVNAENLLRAVREVAKL